MTNKTVIIDPIPGGIDQPIAEAISEFATAWMKLANNPLVASMQTLAADTNLNQNPTTRVQLKNGYPIVFKVAS